MALNATVASKNTTPSGAPSKWEPKGRQLENWVCGKCGLKGHMISKCNKPTNPKAAELVQKAREEAAERRRDMNTKKYKRAKLQANNKGSHESSNSEASPGTTTVVSAGLSVAKTPNTTYSYAEMAIMEKKT
jgi:hypothetical protein